MAATSIEIFRLEGDLSIRDSIQLASDLLTAINAAEVLLVDATGSDRVDISIVQLLIAAHKSARALGKSLTVQLSPKGALDMMLARSGIAGARGVSLVQEGDLWTGLADEPRDKAA